VGPGFSLKVRPGPSLKPLQGEQNAWLVARFAAKKAGPLIRANGYMYRLWLA
jgi:hypothetical protein